MSDLTPGGAGLPDPGIPDVTPDATPPEIAAPEIATPEIPAGDETVRVPAQPEVAWNAPEAPRALPWEVTGAAGQVPDGSTVPPVAAGGVLSAATVGWVAPPPAPLPTGNPGWVIASVGVRFGAWFVDGFLAGMLTIVLIVVLAFIVKPDAGNAGLLTLVYAVLLGGVYFLYFVGFWTGGSKATPGMRIFKLQIANASDGKRLAFGPAVIRWLALGYFLDALFFVPFASLINLVWNIVLLITTNNDSMHQGLHDRWAKSVVVRPEGAGAGGGIVIACLVVLGIFVAIIVFSFVALILLGSQVSKILSTVGASV